jgi:hypothetical protein
VLFSPTKWVNEICSKTSPTFAINKAQKKGTWMVAMEKMVKHQIKWVSDVSMTIEELYLKHAPIDLVVPFLCHRISWCCCSHEQQHLVSLLGL